MKREGCIVMLAFLGGIVLTNLLGANRQIHGQLLNQTFLQQYAYQKVDGNQLFGHVVMVRMQMLVLIFLLGRAVDEHSAASGCSITKKPLPKGEAF